MPKLVVVSIEPEGRLAVMGRRVSQKALGEALRREFTSDADTVVYVRADPNVTYQRVITVYQAIEAQGFEGRVRLLNEEIE